MADRPPLHELIERFGPHPVSVPAGGWESRGNHATETLVKTHCCFCGQQCGIQLKVRDNTVVGFEPWEEFPFNRGKLCPKGVKRYLQGASPDRLLQPLMKDPGKSFRPATWDEAMSFTARRIQEIRAQHGPDAVAIYGGASLTTEKAYLLGKFARLAVGTRHIDYNGRLCMVSAGTAYKLALGIDRAPNSWE
ncbi:MAG TPA: molybdopterin-dependent oxidoreductase, partial [Vicinamibacterales bacterium]|nr:molybdopterin-dependent oxidoreductase [Vicinamibacterales bacterium]